MHNVLKGAVVIRCQRAHTVAELPADNLYKLMRHPRAMLQLERHNNQRMHVPCRHCGSGTGVDRDESRETWLARGRSGSVGPRAAHASPDIFMTTAAARRTRI